MSKTVHEPSRHEIWKMFDQISPTYDRVNRVITLGMDQLWRKRMCRFLPEREDLCVLDCATGTGDQILCLMEHSSRVKRVVGIDLAAEMVALGEKKLKNKPYREAIELKVASALDIPFPDGTFDCVTMSFGIRNVTDVATCLKEFLRVLKPGGRILILEGTIPRPRVLRSVHRFYLRHLLPRLGGWISKKQEAYRYLNETIETFPHGEAFVALMRSAGCARAALHLLMGGIVTIYQGEKGDA